MYSSMGLFPRTPFLEVANDVANASAESCIRQNTHAGAKTSTPSPMLSSFYMYKSLDGRISAKNPLFVTSKAYIVWTKQKWILGVGGILILADTIWGYTAIGKTVLTPKYAPSAVFSGFPEWVIHCFPNTK
ncbi:hypothetical protein BDQ17DRAFT_1331320 [Cyathus striatus]|nr:hypothetical protein BDQ17DRAFT_1331320 [Cyathus striatus]